MYFSISSASSISLRGASTNCAGVDRRVLWSGVNVNSLGGEGVQAQRAKFAGHRNTAISIACRGLCRSVAPEHIIERCHVRGEFGIDWRHCEPRARILPLGEASGAVLFRLPCGRCLAGCTELPVKSALPRAGFIAGAIAQLFGLAGVEIGDEGTLHE